MKNKFLIRKKSKAMNNFSSKLENLWGWASDFARRTPEGKFEKSERSREQSNFARYFGRSEGERSDGERLRETNITNSKRAGSGVGRGKFCNSERSRELGGTHSIPAKNKRGAEKILSIYWFAILIIIAGAIVAMVSLFYGSPYDVREAEANILIDKAVSCLSENGKLNQELFSESKNFDENFNLKEKCDFIFETESKSEREEYFLKTEFYAVEGDEKFFSLSEGNSNLYADCKIQDEKYKKISKCVEREFYSLDPFSDSNAFKIKITSVIEKTEKNVK